MIEYLVFTLAAPMASFGGIAVGERRPSGNRPTKSQIVGFLAAALGIPRAEEQRQKALAASLGYAVRVTDAGLPASDYHTSQRADDVSIRRRVKSHGPLATRRDELACDSLKTVLSMREYRAGVLATVVVWLRHGGPASLEDMRKGLVAPAFVLFAGRKAFPLMLPCRPQLIPAETIEAAITGYDAARSDALRGFESAFLSGRMPRGGSKPVLYADADAILANATQHIDTRRDEPETRAKWGFGVRAERVVPLVEWEDRQ
jgi:CRISPR system Cascade subunit CasD